MRHQVLIGITGRKHSGKTTAAKFLARTHNFRIYSFADPIRTAASHLLDIPIEDVSYDAIKDRIMPEYGKSLRDFLKAIGIAAREVDPDFFLKRMESRLDSKTHPVERVVIQDVRFDNEVDLIQRRKGYILHIDADERLGPNTDTHISENGISSPHKINFTIQNNHYLDQLEFNVWQFAHQILSL